MESEARYTTVGAIVVALLIALAGAVVWLKQVGSERNFWLYTIYFSQQALDGLQIGGDVDVRGIRVGRVEDYALSDGAKRVRVVIRVDRRAPVYENTVAVVTRNLVTGIAGITLVTPEPTGPQLALAPPDEPHPVIAEGQSNLDELTGRVRQLGEVAGETLTSVNELLSPQNRAALSATLVNLRDFSAGLNTRLGALDQTLTVMQAAAADVRLASQQVAVAADDAGRELNPTLAEARRTLAALTGAIQTLEQQIQSTGGRLDGAVASVDDQLIGTMAELRLTLAKTNRTLDGLQDLGQQFDAVDKSPREPGAKRP
jgi:phospholipid/cholesterol/gamma-HCH transport system substrate-binding protein